MKPKSINEQIERILAVSDYKIPETKRVLVEMVTPLGEVTPAAPAAPAAAPAAQGQVAPPQQVNPQQVDATFEREIDSALNQIMRELPQDLQQVATTQGDRDGQLEPVGQAGAQGSVQGTQPAQQVAEAELDEALLATIAGGALAAPAIANLIGKATAFLGKKLDNQTIQGFGEKVSHIADHLHHKYIGTIEKIISPMTRNATPETRHKISMGIFYALVAVLGGAGAIGASHAAHTGNIGLAAVEGGLTGVKASELITAARAVIPKILGQVVA